MLLAINETYKKKVEKLFNELEEQIDEQKEELLRLKQKKCC
jgi:hypothetical protein